MAATYYDSQLTSEQIEAALEAISGLVTASNNGKVIAIENGTLVTKSISEWSDTPVLEPLSVTANGDYTPEEGVDGYNTVHVAVPGGSGGTIEPLSVTQNGTYNPSSGVDGYAPVTVNVSGGSITNLFDGTMEQGTFDEQGLNASNTTRIRSVRFVPVNPNSEYVTIVTKTNQSSFYVTQSVSFYADDQYTTPRLSYTPWTNTDILYFTTPSGCNYIRFLISKNNASLSSITPSEISHIIAATKTDFESVMGI